MRLRSVATIACVWLAAAVAVAGQDGVAEGAVFEPLIIPRDQVLAHRAVDGFDVSPFSRLPVYPKGHWEAAAAASDPRLNWEPAKVKGSDADAARNALVRALHDAAAAKPAALPTPAADSAVAAVADTSNAQTSWERDAENGIRTLAQAVARHAQVIHSNRATSDELKRLAVRVAEQLKRDEEAMARLQQNAAQREANKLVIKSLVRRMDDAAKAIKAVAALIGQNRRQVIDNTKAAEQAVKTVQQHEERIASLKSLHTAELAQKLSKLTTALGEESKALKRDEQRLTKDERRLTRDEKRIKKNRNALRHVKADAKTAAEARAELRETLNALVTRVAALERVATEHKQLVGELRSEMEAEKSGDTTRDATIKQLQTKLAAVEKKATEAELDANDAHHKADAASDAITALHHAHKATESALKANVAAVNAAADRLAGANSVADDHSRRLTEVVAELTALTKRLDAAEGATARARVQSSAQIAHNTAVSTANSARAALVTANGASADKALAGLASLGAKLAQMEAAVKAEEHGNAQARAATASAQKKLSDAVDSLQKRAAAQELREAQAAKAAAVARQQAAAAAAAAQARAIAQAKAAAQAKAIAQAKAQQRARAIALAQAQAKAKAQAQARAMAIAKAQAQAKAKAIAQARAAQAQAQALAVARARAAQHQQQLRAQQAKAAAVRSKGPAKAARTSKGSAKGRRK